MVWKHNSRIIQVGKSWIGDDNTKYPNQWINLTTSEKNAASLVWEDDPTPLAKYDSFYYYGWNSDGDALLPKPLADIKVLKVNQAKETSSDLLSMGCRSIVFTKINRCNIIKCC